MSSPAPLSAAHPLLDNIFWHSLAGPQSAFALGTATARRHAPGFSALVGFADPERPDFAALTPHCEPGERFYCSGWTGSAPAGWRIDAEVAALQMVWDAALPEAGVAEEDCVLLGPGDVGKALALASLTRPGPFGPRTLELGDYFGCFDGERLVAMAGERMFAGSLREISGVCTDPEWQGRGLARRLVLRLVARQLRRGETPFLHVLRDNAAACRLYERIGFRVYRARLLRLVSRCAAAP